MHKNAMKCNKTLSKWCKNKHGASKIIDTFETYQRSELPSSQGVQVRGGIFKSWFSAVSQLTTRAQIIGTIFTTPPHEDIFLHAIPNHRDPSGFRFREA
jgi:hypothetical protein